jgi:hypothetical protein
MKTPEDNSTRPRDKASRRSLASVVPVANNYKRLAMFTGIARGDLHWTQNSGLERDARAWLQWKSKLAAGIAQLAWALHAIGGKHIKDGIHSVARPFPFKLFNVSSPSTPGRGNDTQKAIGK